MHRMKRLFPRRWSVPCLWVWMWAGVFPLAAQTTYDGQASNAAWRSNALGGIERNRTARLAVTVRDAAGFPVPGSLLEFRLIRHGFSFDSTGVQPPTRLGLEGQDDLAAPDRAGLIRLRAHANDQIERGNTVEALGLKGMFQAHLVPPSELLARFDLLSGILSGMNTHPIWIEPVRFDVADADLRRDYARDFLIAAFSHPSVQGIRLAPSDPAGPVSTPASLGWNELIETTWTTRTNVRTSSTGRAVLRGFKGTYEVIVPLPGTRHSTTLELDSDSHLPIQVPVIPPQITVTPGDLYEFRWPAAAFGYRLETTDTSRPEGWEPVDGIARLTPTGWQIQVPPPDSTQLFRLRRHGPAR